MDRIRRVVEAAVPDVLVVGGAIAITYGSALIWPPLGFIVGGVLAIAAGLLWARGS